MSHPNKPRIFVAQADGAVAIRIVGKANVAVSTVFRDILAHLRSEEAGRIHLLLDSCLLMDSTFLGTLAQQGVDHSTATGNPRPGRIVLVQPSARVLELIENLGVLDVFRIETEPLGIEFVFQPLETPTECDLREITRTSLEAHRTLMALNEENQARFEGVTELLEKELEGSEGPGGKGGAGR